MPNHDTGKAALNDALDQLSHEVTKLGDSAEYRLPAPLCAAIGAVLSASGRA